MLETMEAVCSQKGFNHGRVLAPNPVVAQVADRELEGSAQDQTACKIQQAHQNSRPILSKSPFLSDLCQNLEDAFCPALFVL